MAAKKKIDPWWTVNAGTPDGMLGERDGSIQAPDEETARTRYLADRPAGWIIKTIGPGTAPTVKGDISGKKDVR